MSARSVSITLVNDTDLTLALDYKEVSGGVWVEEPPATIEARGEGAWRSDSDGLATGTEGRASYSTGGEQVQVHWDNPFVGSNSLDVGVPPGYTETHGDISGDHADIKISVSKSS